VAEGECVVKAGPDGAYKRRGMCRMHIRELGSVGGSKRPKSADRRPRATQRQVNAHSLYLLLYTTAAKPSHSHSACMTYPPLDAEYARAILVPFRLSNQFIEIRLIGQRTALAPRTTSFR
jgi:hypothetical protein